MGTRNLPREWALSFDENSEGVKKRKKAVSRRKKAGPN
jgi:hypothetical protein